MLFKSSKLDKPIIPYKVVIVFAKILKWAIDVSMLWNKFTFIFHKLCLSVTAALTVTWIYKYALNEDVSVLEYKQYYETDDDVYPVLSLCFNKPFLKDELTQYGINESIIVDFLSGEYISKEILNINYDTLTWDLGDYILKVWIKWRNGSTAILSDIDYPYKGSVSVSYNGFDGNQDTFLKCFGVDIPKQYGNIEKCYLVISNNVFPEGIRPIHWDFQILLHYPNQLLRSLPTTKFSWPQRRDNATYGMKFIIKSVEIVKRREKYNSLCIVNWKNYDSLVLDQHMEINGCKPPYLSSLINLPMCRTKKEMRNAKFGLSTDIITKSLPPCKGVQTISYDYEEHEYSNNSTWADKGNFWIGQDFYNPQYKQIYQSRY